MKHQGNLIIKTQADADKYTSLTEVTGFLSIDASAKLDAPKLESARGAYGHEQFLKVVGSAP